MRSLLDRLLRLYSDEHSQREQEYIRMIVESCTPYASGNGSVFVINNNFGAWGHQFIYDEQTLRDLMEESGFGDVTRCALQESRHPEFRNRAREDRVAEGLVDFETVTLEGTKCSRPGS